MFAFAFMFVFCVYTDVVSAGSIWDGYSWNYWIYFSDFDDTWYKRYVDKGLQSFRVDLEYLHKLC